MTAHFKRKWRTSGAGDGTPPTDGPPSGASVVDSPQLPDPAPGFFDNMAVRQGFHILAVCLIAILIILLEAI